MKTNLVPDWAKALHAQLVKSRPKRSSDGYPDWVKAEAVRLAKAQLAGDRDATANSIAHAVGLAPKTLRDWLGMRPKKRRKAAKAEPKAVAKTPAKTKTENFLVTYANGAGAGALDFGTLDAALNAIAKIDENLNARLWRKVPVEVVRTARVVQQ